MNKSFIFGSIQFNLVTTFDISQHNYSYDSDSFIDFELKSHLTPLNMERDCAQWYCLRFVGSLLHTYRNSIVSQVYSSVL